MTFFRKTNGTETDFIVDISGRKTAFEIKWKHYDQAAPMRKLHKLAKLVGCDKIVLVNINLNERTEYIHYLPGYFLGKWRDK